MISLVLIFPHRVVSSPHAAAPKVARKDSGVDMAADGAADEVSTETDADVVLRVGT